MNCSVITKTGCPHRCLFCDAGVSFGPRFVTRPPQRIMEDLRRDARDYGFHKKDYFFIDAIFNEPLSWAKQVLETIIRSELKLCIYLIIEPTNIDREFARLLKKAGCVMVTTLLNSMDDQVLERMKRPFTVDMVNRTFQLFDREGISYMPQFLLGGPGETRKTIQANIDSLKRWKPIMVDANYGIRILPKAGLQKVALEKGVISEDTDLLKPTFYFSEALKNDREWVNNRIKSMNRFRFQSLFQWPRVIMRSFVVKSQ